MIARLLTSSLIRFGMVAVAGLAIDLAIGWSLATFAGLPLPVAAFFGFCAGAAFNYLLHERWTFGSGSVSARRGSLYLATLLVTLAVRVGTVAAFQAVSPHAGTLTVLVLSTGVSFVVNFLLSRYLVFRPSTRPTTSGETQTL